MGLSKLKAADAATTTGGAQRKTTAFGAILRVKSIEVAEGKPFALVATTMNKARGIGEGVDVRVEFRDADKAERAKNNFHRGNGRSSLSSAEAAKDAVIYVESAYVQQPKEGEPASDIPVINASWLNTLAGADLPAAEAEQRSFISGVFSRAPRVQFENPFFTKEKAGEEPERISIPVNATSVSVKVQGPQGSVSRDMPLEWALERLRAATKSVSVRLETLEVEKAKQVRSEDEVKVALREALKEGTDSFAALRIIDVESGEVAQRVLYPKRHTVDGKYSIDMDGTLGAAFEKPLFSGFDTKLLMAAVSDGSAVLEVIPGYTHSYGANALKDNNAAFKLVKDLKDGQSTRMELIFGKDPQAFASVLLPGIAKSESYDDFMATAVLADRNGDVYALKDLPTEVIPNPGKPLAADEELESESPRPN